MDREAEPLVFDIRRCSTNDGPGVRTVSFLKGCNLNCAWCHNPEGKKPWAELAWFEEKCIGCGTCGEVCPHPDGCVLCGTCAECCPTGARKIYGKRYSPDELSEILLRDRAFYEAAGGGATFSGGECMLYPSYVAKVSERLKKRGVSVAIDTAGNVPFASFEKVLPYADVFLYDIKCLDPDLHRKGTGVGNALILENLDKLIQTGRRIIIRTPEIPDFNMGGEVERVRVYCAERKLEHEVLKYHTFGEDKRKALLLFARAHVRRSNDGSAGAG